MFNKGYVLSKVIYDITHDLYFQSKEILLTKFMYGVDITDICRKAPASVFKSVFKSIPTKSDSASANISYFDALNTDRSHIDITSYKDVIKFNGTYIIIQVNVAGLAITLHTINTPKDRKNLHTFIKKLKNDCKKVDTSNVYAVIDGQYPKYLIGRRKRTFDDVFIPTDIKKEITESVQNFLNNRKFYEDHSIPYHFGILLHGEPGTGKSSIISAISTTFNLIPYYVKIKDIRDLTYYQEELKTWLIEDNSVKLVIIEDVDSSEYACKPTKCVKRFNIEQTCDEDVDTDEEVVSPSVSAFLNVLDGNNCFENVIWIFTTNYIDKIEPAIIRPGRMDKSIYIGYVVDETMSQFLKHHYGKDLPKGKTIKDKVLFSQIQTDVMMNKSFAEIVDKYCCDIVQK